MMESISLLRIHVARTHERMDFHIHVYVNTAVPQRARIQNGAYGGQVRHGRGVPGADVRVEHRRLVERLRTAHAEKPNRSTSEKKPATRGLRRC